MTDRGGLPGTEELMARLRGVIDPELGSNVVELGMAKDAQLEPDGTVRVTLALTTAGCPLRAQIQRDVRARLGSLPGVTRVVIDWTEMTQEERSAAMDRARWNVRDRAPDTEIPPTAKIIAIASGKGGVGKSSVTVNLAVALAARGHTVGVIDADVGGYSIPRMLGVEGRLAGVEGEKKMSPRELPVGPGLLKVVSTGLLVDTEDSALMWRGFMLNRAVQHFLEDVRWGGMDYLLLDMPPGTGDIQMGVARMLPRTEVVIVTTPAVAAQKVAVRAADMARRSYLRVVGVVENMSSFTCEHGRSYDLFGRGGGAALATDVGAPLLGQIPLEPAVAAGGDTGSPVALGEGPAAEAFRELAGRIVESVVPPIEMAGCTARLLDQVEQALGPKPTSDPVLSRPGAGPPPA